MQLPHPDSSQKFDRVIKDAQGNELWGYRSVMGEQEIVHIPSGQSNMKFWSPEIVSNPEGCSHDFFIEDMGKREIKCRRFGCEYGFTFHPNDIIEDQSGTFVQLKGVKYKVSL